MSEMNDLESRQPTAPEAAGTDDPRTITRPDPALHTHYLITSLFGLFLFPFIYLPLYFKYQTMRYRFEDDGVSMSWGRFQQRETYLNYRRIQDIQVSRGLIQRWLGLASLQLQTASGGTGAEMTIEGIRHPERLRDFLYERMRGSSDDEGGAGGVQFAEVGVASTESAGATGRPADSPAPDAALELLREIRDEVRRLRRAADGAGREP